MDFERSVTSSHGHGPSGSIWCSFKPPGGGWLGYGGGTKNCQTTVQCDLVKDDWCLETSFRDEGSVKIDWALLKLHFFHPKVSSFPYCSSLRWTLLPAIQLRRHCWPPAWPLSIWCGRFGWGARRRELWRPKGVTCRGQFFEPCHWQVLPICPVAPRQRKNNELQKVLVGRDRAFCWTTWFWPIFCLLNKYEAT